MRVLDSHTTAGARPSRPGPRAGALLAILLAGGASVGCGDEGLGRVFPHLEVAPEAVDFGPLPVLQRAEAQVVLENLGAAPLQVEALEVTGADAGRFSVLDAPTAVEPGARVTVVLGFRPEAERTYEATLRLVSNDPDRPEATLALAGEGRTAGCITVTPAALDFGTVGEGETAVESLTIQAGCTAPLVVESVGFDAATPPEYAPVGSFGTGTLEVGEQVPLSVAFAPKVGQTDLDGALVIRSTDPATPEVRVPLTAALNRAPVPACGDPVVAAPLDEITLDGSGSYDPDGDEPLAFDWRIARRPLDSASALVGADTATPSLALDVPGEWEVTLGVVDTTGVASPAPCRVTVQAVPAEQLYVELVWDHPVTDLDLHWLAPDGRLYGPGDCWWNAPAPDFGVQGSAEDDPRLDRDALAGFGPELVSHPAPAAGRYRVVVDYYKDNGAADPATRATVRVYVLGVLAAELSRTLEGPGRTWTAAEVDWPSGRVTAVDEVSGP